MPHNDLIFKKLAEVIDPELGIDIVQLGLIRSVEVSDYNFIKVVMTLTTPMCPFADMIIEDVEYKLSELLDYDNSVELSFNPPWEATEEVRMLLGI